MSLTNRKKLIYICLLIIGVILVVLGMMVNPSFVARHLGVHGVLHKPTVIETYILETLIITLGVVISLYSSLAITECALVTKINETAPLDNIVLFGLIISYLTLILPSLLYYVLRMGYMISICYNEGWNVVHTTRLLHGKQLYLPLTGFPLTPVNYPPLSFVIIGTLSHFTGSVLLI
jgi:hypothetical protein